MKKNETCNLDNNFCGEKSNKEISFQTTSKKIDFYYFNDPVCIHCYLLEPIINKFLYMFGKYLNVNIVMGGLIQNWDFSNPNHNTPNPQQLAKAWNAADKTSQLPIDGSIWLDNPISSSFPASQIYEVIKTIDNHKASQFLRLTRFYTFAFRQNISEHTTLIELVNLVGLDGKTIVSNELQKQTYEILDEGFYTARSFEVTSYPTVIMVNPNNDGIIINGRKPLQEYINAFTELTLKDNFTPDKLPKLADLLNDSILLFTHEIKEMYGITDAEMTSFISKNLPQNSFTYNEVLGRKYIETKKTD